MKLESSVNLPFYRMLLHVIYHLKGGLRRKIAVRLHKHSVILNTYFDNSCCNLK